MPKSIAGKIAMWTYVTGFWFYLLFGAVIAWPRLPLMPWLNHVGFQALCACFGQSSSRLNCLNSGAEFRRPILIESRKREAVERLIMQYRIERAARRMGEFALFALALPSYSRSFQFYNNVSLSDFDAPACRAEAEGVSGESVKWLRSAFPASI